MDGWNTIFFLEGLFSGVMLIFGGVDIRIYIYTFLKLSCIYEVRYFWNETNHMNKTQLLAYCDLWTDIIYCDILAFVDFSRDSQ